MTDVNVINPSGEPVSIDQAQLPDALNQGYQVESKDQTYQRRAVTQYVKDNDNIAGSLKVLGGQFADEFLGGLPETVLEHNSTDLENAKREALKKSHKVANTLGGVGGFATSMALPIGVLGKVSEGANVLGKSASKAIEAGIGAENLVGKLGSKAVGTLAQTAIEGAGATAPQSLAHIIDGDPEQAGETMLAGALLGMTSAPIHLLTDAVLPAVSGGAKKYKQDLSDFVLEQASKVGQKVESAKDLTADKIAQAATTAGAKAAKMVAKDLGTDLVSKGTGMYLGAKLGSVMGPAGSAIGAAGGYFAGKTLEPLMERGANELIEPAAKKVGETLGEGYERVKAAKKAWDTNAGEQFVRGANDEWIPVASPMRERLQAVKEALFNENPEFRNIDIDDALLEKAVKEHGWAMRFGDAVVNQFNQIPQYMKSLETGVNVYAKARHIAATGASVAGIDLLNPGDWQNHISQINSMASAPPLQTGSPYEEALSAQQQKAAQYLQKNLPPMDLDPKPFESEVTLPNRATLQPYKDKLATVMNPFSTLKSLAEGTLNENQMDALLNVYPKLYDKMKADVALLGMDKKYQKMSPGKRNAIGLFLGQPVSKSFSPEYVQLTQQMYQQQQPKKQPPPSGKPLNLPSFATNTQKVAMG